MLFELSDQHPVRYRCCPTGHAFSLHSLARRQEKASDAGRRTLAPACAVLRRLTEKKPGACSVEAAPG